MNGGANIRYSLIARSAMSIWLGLELKARESIRNPGQKCKTQKRLLM